MAARASTPDEATERAWLYQQTLRYHHRVPTLGPPAATSLEPIQHAAFLAELADDIELTLRARTGWTSFLLPCASADWQSVELTAAEELVLMREKSCA